MYKLVLLIFISMFHSVLLTQVSVECNKDSVNDVFLVTPSKDNIRGRYSLTWCLENVKAGVYEWSFVLLVDDRSAEKCTIPTDGSLKHSIFYEDVPVDKCTDVCLSYDLDLIYRGCYQFINSLVINKHIHNHTERTLYIDNDITQELLANMNTFQSPSNYSTKDMTFYLSTNYIPLTEEHHIEIYRVEELEASVVSCEVWGEYEEKCVVGDAAPHNYTGLLQYDTPWALGDVFGGNFSRVRFNISFVPPEVSRVEVSPASAAAAGGGVVWTAVAALVVALLVVAGLLLSKLTPLTTTTITKRIAHKVRPQLTPRSSDAEQLTCEPGTPEDSGEVVVVVWERDHDLLMTAAHHLVELLHRANPGKVWDLYSARSVSACALSRSPARWLSDLVDAPRSKVLLLQTPAAAATHTVNAQGVQVVSRGGEFGSQMFGYVLSLLQNKQHSPDAYRKFYIASIAGLDVDVVPNTCPFRRYPLPAALPLLLRELAPSAAAPTPADLEPLTGALLRYTRYVQLNRDYLGDHLMFLDDT